jgi:quercetin dioxygenase-like cupin family protein
MQEAVDMKLRELEKNKKHMLVDMVGYVPNAIISKTIIKKATGVITAMSFSQGEELSEKSFPFDSFIQVIDGAADVHMGSKAFHLELGMGMIIPAHALHRFNAKQAFKMISIIIKSGYED